ncbi:MAG TPA: ATP-dependent DNA ligase [Allocoleopsis sp.]
MTTTTFPVLFDYRTKTKPRFWRIYVENNETFSVIVVEYGQIDGKVTENKRIVETGKNIGKINETTHFTQAVSEAKTKWEKKKDSGYVEKDSTPKIKTVLPMLAHSFDTRSHDIVFPCYSQPKLDGVRSIYNVSQKKMQSRLGKFFPHLQFILDELKDVQFWLDGELYSDTLDFQTLVGLVKKEYLSNEDIQKMKEISFIVYDLVDHVLNYQDRIAKLKKFFSENKFQRVKLLKTEVLDSRDALDTRYTSYISDGYEGLILRNFEGMYEEKNRSKNLQKYKKFMDSEFKIVSFTEGEGIEKGLVIWICETNESKQFRVRPKGTHTERKKLFKNGKKYIGKYLTVKYFELTNEGLPRFPVGITIRDYE